MVEHGTESECGTCRHEMVLDRRWTDVENHPENPKRTSIDLWISLGIPTVAAVFQLFTEYFLPLSCPCSGERT